jgi:hypothetical protein
MTETTGKIWKRKEKNRNRNQDQTEKETETEPNTNPNPKSSLSILSTKIKHKTNKHTKQIKPNKRNKSLWSRVPVRDA